MILARSGPFEKFVSDLLFAQSRRGLHSRRARALAGAGAAAHAGAGDAGAAAEAEAEPDATAAENSGGDDPLALQCSLEAIVAAAFARSVGGVHFCATNSSAAEDVLEEMSGYDADERTQLLRWLTGAAVAVFAGFLLSRVQHLIHAYPTVFSLSLNTFSSVGLIFTNKVLYQRGCDYGGCKLTPLTSPLSFDTVRFTHDVGVIISASCSRLVPLRRLRTPSAPSAAVTLVGMNFLATSSVNLCVRREGKGESKGAVAAVGPSQGDKAKVFGELPPTPPPPRRASEYFSHHRQAPLVKHKAPTPQLLIVVPTPCRHGPLRVSRVHVPHHFEPIPAAQQRGVLSGAINQAVMIRTGSGTSHQ